ncbi:hypothetical protein LOK49_LG01G03498 [Camellia lanceoleosa]|uniref:Uncharacterized protein n=1 Tax=Camellia lanceoleosa TaxID=1840588 RepID=A0ACC0J1Y1_9ERIC|nr:hypothetical protein LOK49_LG01G03498 [Camellia lanceoleosa]
MEPYQSSSPRVSGIHTLLDSFEPIHGVLLCEEEDIDPSFYEAETIDLSQEELEDIMRLHASDTAIDKEKDTIKIRLAKLCLKKNIPYLGICRGSQVLNVACGGTLYQDIGKELSEKLLEDHERVVHVDYDDYDGHRHVVKKVEITPLHHWFKDSLKDSFYDPDAYNPEESKFITGLQFHPERMRRPDSDEFDYPGCPAAYQEFVKAVIAYQKRINSTTRVPKSLKLDQEMEKKKEVIIRSFSLARIIYAGGREMLPSKESELEVGAEFLQSNTALSSQQENRLKQMGATVRNASSYLTRLMLNEERESLARKVIGKMPVEQISELVSFLSHDGSDLFRSVRKKSFMALSMNLLP